MPVTVDTVITITGIPITTTTARPPTGTTAQATTTGRIGRITIPVTIATHAPVYTCQGLGL